MNVNSQHNPQTLAFKKLRLLGLSKQLLITSETKAWDEFSVLNAQFQELFELLKTEQPSALDDVLKELIEDNRQYELNIQKSMRTLSKQHAQDVSGVKKLKAYLKEV